MLLYSLITVFTDTTLDQAIDVLDRVRRIFQVATSSYVEGGASFSAGLALNDEGSSLNDEAIEVIIKRADDKLYAAKESGKGISLG